MVLFADNIQFFRRFFLVSADKSKKARSCCSCAASEGQTEATERQRVPAGEVISK